MCAFLGNDRRYDIKLVIINYLKKWRTHISVASTYNLYLWYGTFIALKLYYWGGFSNSLPSTTILVMGDLFKAARFGNYPTCDRILNAKVKRTGIKFPRYVYLTELYSLKWVLVGYILQYWDTNNLFIYKHTNNISNFDLGEI